MSESDDRISRLYRLESAIEEMRRSETRLEAKVMNLEKELDVTKKKLTTAETWGRVILYCALAAGGFLSQIQAFARWIKAL